MLNAAEAGRASMPWWILVLVVVVVVVVGVSILLLASRRAKGAEVPCRKCGRILLPQWTHCMFCKTPRDDHPAALKFVSGPLAGRTLTLEGEVTTIGSAPGSSILLTDGGVSRKHCGIRVVEGGYELADMGSTNGVYVNGEKVAKKTLQLGDVIRIGTTEIVFKS